MKEFYEDLKWFFKSLLSKDGDISQRRFQSFFGMIMLSILIIGSMYGVTMNDSILYILTGIILGSSALSSFIK